MRLSGHILAVSVTLGTVVHGAPQVQDWLRQGDALLLVGSYDKAAEAFRRALEVNPKSISARVKLADALWRTGHAPQALELLEPLAADTLSPEALSLLSDVYLDRRDYLKASGTLERLLKRRPSPLLRMQLADCYAEMAKLGNPEARARALALYDHVEGRTRDPQLRQRAIDGTLRMRHGELGEELLAAKRLLALGKSLTALEKLRLLARDHPRGPAFMHYLMGMALLSPEVDDRDKAATALRRAEQYPPAASQLGVLAYEDGDLERAAQLLERAVASDPRDQRALFHLGLVRREEGHDAKARAAWRRAIAVDPGTSVARWAKTKLAVLSGHLRTLAPGQVIDPASEIAIGKRTSEAIERRWPVLRDARLEQRLRRVLARLLRQTEHPKRFKVAVINVPIPNALTVPNGKIYIFTGLVDLIRTRMGDSDDVYAAVLAHELAHNTLRHTVGMLKMASTQKEYHSYWQLSRLMGALSREHEFEADQYGALYAYRAGYDPAAGVRLHQKMLQHRGEIPRGMSHPQHGQRIERLHDYLLELRAKVRHFKKGVAALKRASYDEAIDNFELFLGVFPDSAAARNNLALALHRQALLNTRRAPVFRRSTDLDPDARIRTIKLRTSAQERRALRVDKRLLREAVSEYQILLRQHGGYAIGHTNLGAALSDLGELRRARRHLEAAIAQRPGYAQAHNNLAVVRAQLGDLDGAARAFARALQLDPKYAPALFNLALVYERQNRPREAARQWARYLTLDPASGWTAIARARQAALAEK